MVRGSCHIYDVELFVLGLFTLCSQGRSSSDSALSDPQGLVIHAWTKDLVASLSEYWHWEFLCCLQHIIFGGESGGVHTAAAIGAPTLFLRLR